MASYFDKSIVVHVVVADAAAAVCSEEGLVSYLGKLRLITYDGSNNEEAEVGYTSSCLTLRTLFFALRLLLIYWLHY